MSLKTKLAKMVSENGYANIVDELADSAANKKLRRILRDCADEIEKWEAPVNDPDEDEDEDEDQDEDEDEDEGEE